MSGLISSIVCYDKQTPFLNFSKAVKLKYGIQAYYVFKEPISLNFPSIGDETLKRRIIANKLSNMLEEGNQISGAIGYGSSFYGSANVDSDIDIAGISLTGEPFKAFFIVKNQDNEKIEVSIRGFILGHPIMSFTGREKLEEHISGKMGLWSLTYPNLFENVDSQYAACAKIDALDIIRRILHDCLEEGNDRVTCDEIVTRFICMQHSLNQSFFKKERHKRGLKDVVAKNILDGLWEFDGKILKRNGDHISIFPELIEIKKEPIEYSQMDDRIKEREFREKFVGPVIEKYWSKKYVI